MMNRREFLSSLAAASAFPVQAAARRPNIVFILADDLGYGDLGCYGQEQIPTPNIDRIAAQGTRFTQAYSGSTVCAPSRCCLMTGHHTGHARIRGNARVPLIPSDVTVAKLLKSAGYRTAMYGKWGLGNPGTTGVPNLQGFDDWFGYLDQQHAHSYYPQSLWDNQSERMIPGNLGTRKTWSPDLIEERALEFLGRQSSQQPFYLNLTVTLPHANNELGSDTGNGMEVPSDEPFTNRPWPQQEKNFAAMVTRLDRTVGKVLEQLKKSGVDENTIIFFSSDNGPHREGGHNPDFFHSRGPLRGIKRDLYEGGIRVPMLVRWPGHVPSGKVSDFSFAFWDFLPTAAELAGVTAPKGIDGVSVVPALLGKAQQPHPYFYWEFHERGFSQAVRMGDWKGVRLQSRNAPLELYDLKSDVGEKNNIAAAHPEVVARIRKIMDEARTDSADFPVHAGPAGAKKAAKKRTE
ncbi:MAG: arylsulfatase [Bryobacteraceae bacterium]